MYKINNCNMYDRESMKLAGERISLNQNKKLWANKINFQSENNISRICLDTLLKSLINQLKNGKLDIKFERFTVGKFDEIKKHCVMSIKKRGKRETLERIERPNSEKYRTLGEKEKLGVPGNIGSGHNQTSGHKQIKHLCNRNLMKV